MPQLNAPGFVTLTAAYGRFYHDRDSVLNDWDQGRDFRIINGPYCSKRDAEVLKKKFHSVYIRYGVDKKSIKVL
jgi:hypothetical protein